MEILSGGQVMGALCLSGVESILKEADPNERWGDLNSGSVVNTASNTKPARLTSALLLHE